MPHFVFRKKIRKKYVCLPYLKFSDPLSETRFFYLALLVAQARGPRAVREGGGGQGALSRVLEQHFLSSV